MMTRASETLNRQVSVNIATGAVIKHLVPRSPLITDQTDDTFLHNMFDQRQITERQVDAFKQELLNGIGNN